MTDQKAQINGTFGRELVWNVQVYILRTMILIIYSMLLLLLLLKLDFSLIKIILKQNKNLDFFHLC